jgi:hypothetical protein
LALVRMQTNLRVSGEDDPIAGCYIWHPDFIICVLGKMIVFMLGLDSSCAQYIPESPTKASIYEENEVIFIMLLGVLRI